ncbi:MAG: peptidase [Thiotrichaceae bacterium IS1]|nr:MAG: peptidase [Thiotrichaceae bacterium IS1]
MLKNFLISLIITSFIVGCVTSPMGRSQLAFMPASQLDTMGIEAFNSLKKDTPINTNPSTNQYVTCITQSILQTFENKGQNWEVVVFRDDAANAFALPGGKVGVYDGLLDVAKNQDQLATVIGHEIAHVISQHGNERVSQQFALEQGLTLIQAIAKPTTQKGQLLMGLLGLGAQVGILLPYSRIQESEADALGLQLMARAGFNPQQSVALWQNMSQAGDGGQPLEFLSTHPSHGRRIQNLNKMMGSALQLQQQVSAGGKNPRCQ